MGNIQPVYPSKFCCAERSGAMDFQPVLRSESTGGSAPTQIQTTPTPVSPSPRRKIIILVLIILVLVGTVLAIVWITQRAPSAAAKVGREKISFEQVADFSRDCDLAQKEAVEYLVDEKVLTKWASDEKITISDEEQKAEELRISGVESPADCLKLEAKVNLLREKLAQNTTKFREGKFIVVNFDRYTPSPFGLRTAEATQEADTDALLKEEKAYADNLIQSIYSELKANKTTFDQAIERVKNDPKVGTNGYYSTSLQSGPFTADDYIKRNGLFASETVKEKVDSLKEEKFSEPFIEQVNVSQCLEGDQNCQPTYADARWVIAKVERIGGQGEGKTAEDFLKEIRQKYGTKIYLK